MFDFGTDKLSAWKIGSCKSWIDRGVVFGV